MATLVTFHAHADDEAIATGGTMMKAAAAGHRVVLVVATDGARGEIPPGLLGAEETLAERREHELYAAAGILGTHRVELLGYGDSGMMGADTNTDTGSFWTADVGEAAERLASILREEDAAALTIYDSDGSYGHPDHIQVHRVGMRAAELAGTPTVYESVIAREEIERNIEQMRDAGFEFPGDMDIEGFGVPESTVTTRIDVRPYLDRKRAAMEAHASQIPPTSFFLTMPPEAFELGFGWESYRRVSAASSKPGLLDQL